MAVQLDEALRINGWMQRRALVWLGLEAQKAYRIAEIGSYRGRSTMALLANTPGRVWAVDTWNYGKCGDEDYQAFLVNTKQYAEKLTALRMDSISAAEALQAEHGKQFFDLVFIDAAHDYDSVYQDILAWRPLVKPGGVLSGHDYSPRTWPGVVRAVEELVRGFCLNGTIWYSRQGSSVVEHFPCKEKTVVRAHPLASDLDFYCYLKANLPDGYEIVSEPDAAYYSEWCYHYTVYSAGVVFREYKGDFQDIRPGSLICAARELLEEVMDADRE